MNIARKIQRATEIAYALKSKSPSGRAFHVTTVFDKNRIVSIGVNTFKTHPQAYKYKKLEIINEERYVPTIHSELSAILKMNKEDCSDLLFFNIRIDNNNKLNNSYPCSGCVQLLKQVGFNKLFYSTNVGGFKEYITHLNKQQSDSKQIRDK